MRIDLFGRYETKREFVPSQRGLSLDPKITIIISIAERIETLGFFW